MTGALPFPGDYPPDDFGMGFDTMEPPAPAAPGGLPLPGGLSPETRQILMDQIKKLSQPQERKPSLWSDPAFLAGLTLLGGGNLGQAGMAAARMGAQADQNREIGETRRATALASLSGQLAQGERLSAQQKLLSDKARREAVGSALSLVPATQRGRLGKLLQGSQIDPSDLAAVFGVIEQNQLPLAPNFKSVQGVGLVDISGDQPQVVIPAQRAPQATPEFQQKLIAAGFTPGTPEFQAEVKKMLGGGGGPFTGAGMDPQMANILLKGDPMSADYELAFLDRYGPRQVTQPDGTTVVMQPPVPMGIPRPGTPRQAGAPAQAMPSPPVQQPSAGPAPAGPPVSTTPLPGGGSVSRVGEPRISPAEKAKMDKAIAEAATLSNSLDDYVNAFSEAGASERAMSVAGVNTPSNTAYSNAALLAKGEVLFELGVLNGPDLTIIQKTLADPSTLKGQVAGPEAAKAAATTVRRLIQDRLNASRRQQNLPPLDIAQYGKSLRGKPGDPGRSGRFATMAPDDLKKVDVSTLSAEELEAFIEATK